MKERTAHIALSEKGSINIVEAFETLRKLLASQNRIWFGIDILL
jgi:hypothetical protein